MSRRTFFYGFLPLLVLLYSIVEFGNYMGWWVL